jgi:hypothetical protein
MTNAKDLRLPALRRFAFAITLLNVLGHTWLGFEQAWAAPLVGVGTAYLMETLLETISAWQQRRRPRYLGERSDADERSARSERGDQRLRLHGGRRIVEVIDFLLSAHITGLAVAMLLYSDDRMGPIAFGTAVAIGSKYILRVPTADGGGRHFLNPSNFGITVTLLCFASVGIAQPYMFTAGLNPTAAWVLPVILIGAGLLLNALFTHRLPLIAAWVGGFVLQAMVRWAVFGNRPLASLLPLTGMALLLYTFYMVTDPATTPKPPLRQAVFGASVAASYGILVSLHIVFAPFFGLTLISCGRGAMLWAAWAAARRRAAALPGGSRVDREATAEARHRVEPPAGQPAGQPVRQLGG